MLKGFVKGISSYPKLNDGDWLRQKYEVERWCTNKIGEEIGCDGGTVYGALKRHSIQPRTHAEVAKGNENCLGRYMSKETRNKIGKARKGWRGELGWHHSEETKKKIGDTKRIFSFTQRRLNGVMRSRIRQALNGAKGGRHWKTLVGYSLADLMQTLEKEFRDGMSWENYGAVWHIDHIIPLARFEYNSPEDIEFKKAWALNNLQPLLVVENYKKGTKFRFY